MSPNIHPIMKVCCYPIQKSDSDKLPSYVIFVGNEQSGSSVKKQGGLQNIGNSCYLNSVIQCLLHCDPIRDYFVRGRFKSEINSRSKTKGSLIKVKCTVHGFKNIRNHKINRKKENALMRQVLYLKIF